MDDRKSTVKLNFMLHDDGSRKSLTLPRNTSVGDIKSMLRQDVDFNRAECEILFCGHAMKNEDKLQDFNIGSQTTLHVVTRATEEHPGSLTIPQEKSNISRIPYLTGIWLHRMHTKFPIFTQFGISCPNSGPSLSTKHPQFYVYCKDRCMSITHGKLRVRCDHCKQDSIVLHKDPRGWSDALRSGQILGNCFSKECDGALCDAEFYFKCAQCQNPESGGVVPLPNVVSNLGDILCLTCIDAESPVVCFPCSTEHVMCLACFEQYARSSLRERKMVLDENIGYSVPCPSGCRGSYLSDPHVFHILGIDEYMTYQAFAAEECLIHEMRGMVCPNPNCGTGLYPDLAFEFQEQTKITCTSCGHEFCSSCREAHHGSSKCGTSVSSNPGSSTLVGDYLASVKTIEEISKKCPKCKIPTERDGGCMHMTCGRCKFEWCWNCLTEWNRSCQANHWFT